MKDSGITEVETLEYTDGGDLVPPDAVAEANIEEKKNDFEEAVEVYETRVETDTSERVDVAPTPKSRESPLPEPIPAVPATEAKPATPEPWQAAMSQMSQQQATLMEQVGHMTQAIAGMGRRSAEPERAVQPASYELEDQLKEFARWKVGDNASDHEVETYANQLAEAAAYSHFGESEHWRESPQAQQMVENARGKFRERGAQTGAFRELKDELKAVRQELGNLQAIPQQQEAERETIAYLIADLEGDSSVRETLPTLAKFPQAVSEYAVRRVRLSGKHAPGSEEGSRAVATEMWALEQDLAHAEAALKVAGTARKAVLTSLKAMATPDRVVLLDQLAQSMANPGQSAVPTPGKKMRKTSVQPPPIGTSDAGGQASPGQSNFEEERERSYNLSSRERFQQYPEEITAYLSRTNQAN